MFVIVLVSVRTVTIFCDARRKQPCFPVLRERANLFRVSTIFYKEEGRVARPKVFLMVGMLGIGQRSTGSLLCLRRVFCLCFSRAMVLTDLPPFRPFVHEPVSLRQLFFTVGIPTVYTPRGCSPCSLSRMYPPIFSQC